MPPSWLPQNSQVLVGGRRSPLRSGSHSATPSSQMQSVNELSHVPQQYELPVQATRTVNVHPAGRSQATGHVVP